MEGLLDVRAIEVNYSTGRLVVTFVDYAKLAERMRTSLGDVVDVEARVHLEDATIKVVELIAAVVIATRRLWENWEWLLRWRELEVSVQVGRVVAIVLALSQLREESIVKVD